MSGAQGAPRRPRLTGEAAAWIAEVQPSAAEIVERYGVEESTAYKWRRRLGLRTDRVRGPGLTDEAAEWILQMQPPAQDIADRYGVDLSTGHKWRRRLGIRSDRSLSRGPGLTDEAAEWILEANPSPRTIADRYEIDPATAYKWRKRLGLRSSDRYKPKLTSQVKEWLVNEHPSEREVMDRCGVPRDTVRLWFQRLDVPTVGSRWHRLSDADAETLTGTCSICGPVKVERIRGGQRLACPEGATAAGMRGPHGLTVLEARRLREGKSCAICGSTERLVVDHCHVKLKIRGILCAGCNSGLGYFRDSPELLMAAAVYLQTEEVAS
jgi:transposase